MLELVRFLGAFSFLGFVGAIATLWLCFVAQAFYFLLKRYSWEEFKNRIAKTWANWYATFLLPEVAFGCVIGVSQLPIPLLPQKAWGSAGVGAGLIIAEAFSWYMWSNKHKASRFAKTLYYLSPLLIPLTAFLFLVLTRGN